MKYFIPLGIAKKALASTKKRMRRDLRNGETISVIVKHAGKKDRENLAAAEDFLLTLIASVGGRPIGPWLERGKTIQTHVLKG